MNILNSFLIISTIFIITSYAEEPATPQSDTKTNSTATEKTTVVHPTVKTLDSNLCKVCHCYAANKTLDCSNSNRTTWFSDNDWEALQYGDIQFDAILLNDNQLTDIPKFPNITVKYLLLQNNNIENITARAFQDLSKLEEINLEHNRLTSKALRPDVFEGKYSPVNYEPLNVKKLNLAYNEIHSLDPDLFEHFPQLTTLLLNNNKFNIIDHLSETAISSLVTLKVLDFSYTGIKDLPEYIFHSPRDLEELRLSGNLFQVLPKALEYAVNLKTLYLDDLNLLEDIEDKNVFPTLTKLEVLHMSYCGKLKKIGSEGLSKLEGLKKLYMANNPSLAEIDPNAFARNRQNHILFDYPPLEEMYLHNNNLSLLESVLIERWDKVKVIDLRHNAWKCDCTNDFVINVLFTQLMSTNPNLTDEVKCNVPKEWHGKEIKEIHQKKTSLRCEDLYGNHPENDASVLIGMLIGVLVGIPIAFAILLIYRRGCFGLLDRNNPGRYSKAFYSRTGEDDYHI